MARSSGRRAILTYSGPQILAGVRTPLDGAADRAWDNGLMTCFIHYDHERNILPYGMFPFGSDYARQPDLNIWHYDYNVLYLEQYQRWVDAGRTSDSGDDIPHFSMSSTSPVTAGMLAVLKSTNAGLQPAEYGRILKATSRLLVYEGQAPFERGESPRVPDLAAAVRELRSGR